MKVFYPRFRWFLFVVNTAFMLGAILAKTTTVWPTGPGFLNVMAESIFTLWVVCSVPAVCAVAFGGFGNAALQMLAKKENVIWSYGLLLLVFMANAPFVCLLLAQEFSLFNGYEAANLLVCIACFVAVYHQVIFRQHSCACYATVRHWLTA